jgi:hypothetical protein
MSPGSLDSTLDIEGVESESAQLDFKASFDPDSKRDWCELTKDLVAMANSGGGSILVGVNDDGIPSRVDAQRILNLDPAQMTDKLHSHTGQQFSEFTISAVQRQGHQVALISIGAARIPLCFVRPGQYELDGRTKSAFAQGTVYFRHGAKSETGTTDDFRESIERELQRVRAFWLSGIAKVVEAPTGSTVSVDPPEVSLQGGDTATPIRLTTQDGAQTFKVIEFDTLYPYRQKELVAKLRAELGGAAVTSHYIQVIRRLNDVDKNPNYSGQSKYGSRQYSEAFVEWLVASFRSDNNFFRLQLEAFRKPSST